MQSKALNVRVVMHNSEAPEEYGFESSRRFTLAAEDSKGFRYHLWTNGPEDRSYRRLHRNAPDAMRRFDGKRYGSTHLDPHAASNLRFIESMHEQAFRGNLWALAEKAYNDAEAARLKEAHERYLGKWRAYHADELLVLLQRAYEFIPIESALRTECSRMFASLANGPSEAERKEFDSTL